MDFQEEKRYRIVMVSGSPRPGNNTAKAVALVADELEKHPQLDYSIIDMQNVHLPFPGQHTDSSVQKSLQEMVQKATALILATP